jgi:hypothetical protein
MQDKPLLNWSNQPIQPPQPTNENPMIAQHGPYHDARVRCKSCVHIYELARATPVRRCALRGDMKHLMNWHACAKFKLREGPMDVYDGRR